MDEFIPKELALLADYFAQELSPEQMAEASNWINENPGRQCFVADLKRSRLALDGGLGTVLSNESEDVRNRLSDISLRLSALREQEQVGLPGNHYNPIPAMWYSIGGFVAGALIIAGFVFGIGGGTPSTSGAMSVYSTNNGERATVLLPDGSSIKLNVATRVQVPSDYSEHNRTVFLDGEAIFSVNHKGGKPFTVISGPSVTRVLGTRFVVRHYLSDSVALVAVQDGRVSVGNMVVSAGQEISVNETRISEVATTSESRFEFESGMLNLDKVTLADAIPELNRWYNADIKLGSQELGFRKVIGGFRAGSVTDLAVILELTFDVKVVRQERTLILYAK